MQKPRLVTSFSTPQDPQTARPMENNITGSGSTFVPIPGYLTNMKFDLWEEIFEVDIAWCHGVPHVPYPELVLGDGGE
jgi:hypothetical protein